MFDEDSDDYKSSKATNTFAFIICCIFYYQLVFLKQEHIFIDYLNLAFHESGHLFFSWGSEVIHFIGGTLGQLIMPLAIAIVFFVKNQKLPGMLILFWFFENFINISIYVADAQSMDLPYVPR